MASIFSSLFRRAPQAPANAIVFPFTIEANPYRCKRIWPPEFENLSEKHKFRLERRYRRRAKLKWARPNWTKGVKLATWASITFVIVYGVLFMETDEGTPFDGIRRAYAEQVSAMNESREDTKADNSSPVALKQPS
ncbi:unnamed protein product [Zymoseptoria tritici ST99CH_1A5]|uniref:Uncharacterized protein n=4 Tax=Zymoseptoria tritici TaxID=1047171 RepID=F9WY67_ZYMTI|nr:uncharacterized protein MYCGRDRAFT_102570 [Zymoseptoria tritici IPO323]SMQ46116.1 unnamed protein product [Zymoseptoria tritici ST99CH_3D7]SMR42461.1 unnamed protein product [Zymoseptoria tritici ST99CH_1E4]SMR44639.1 unnamed protein product [Zymoseptoria tritici ST99CH_3D1]SMY19802.1 unnamed protein product [Zymoseptoria tritici ST99CH_1A5]EGP92243.1 hypothetical protein MYCGRDRAFT_102570 [Zymoseptoria tritici IPO323]